MKRVSNWIYRLLFTAALAAGFLGALRVGQTLWPHAAAKPLPPPLQKYLGRKDYPPAIEPDPRVKSGVQMPEEIGR